MYVRASCMRAHMPSETIAVVTNHMSNESSGGTACSPCKHSISITTHLEEGKRIIILCQALTAPSYSAPGNTPVDGNTPASTPKVRYLRVRNNAAINKYAFVSWLVTVKLCACGCACVCVSAHVRQCVCR